MLAALRVLKAGMTGEQQNALPYADYMAPMSICAIEMKVSLSQKESTETDG